MRSTSRLQNFGAGYAVPFVSPWDQSELTHASIILATIKTSQYEKLLDARGIPITILLEVKSPFIPVHYSAIRFHLSVLAYLLLIMT